MACSRRIQKNDKRLYDAVTYSRESVPTKVATPLRDFLGMLDGMVYGDDAMSGLVREDDLLPRRFARRGGVSRRLDGGQVAKRGHRHRARRRR